VSVRLRKSIPYNRENVYIYFSALQGQGGTFPATRAGASSCMEGPRRGYPVRLKNNLRKGLHSFEGLAIVESLKQTTHWS